jgi:hypothetical protein
MRYESEVWARFLTEYPEYNFDAAKAVIRSELQDSGFQIEVCNNYDLLAAAQSGGVQPLVLERADVAPPTKAELIETIVGMLKKFGSQTDHTLSTARYSLGFKSEAELVIRLNELVRKQQTKHWSTSDHKAYVASQRPAQPKYAPYEDLPSGTTAEVVKAALVSYKGSAWMAKYGSLQLNSILVNGSN